MHRWGEKHRDVQWLWKLPTSLASLYDHPMEVLREWSAAIDSIESNNLEGLRQCLMEIPQKIENLDFELIDHGDELSAVATAPIVMHGICTANTATFVLEYCWRYFDWLFEAVGFREMEFDPEQLQAIPYIDLNTAPLPRLTPMELRRLEALIEQEVCRAYDRRTVTGRAMPDDKLSGSNPDNVQLE